jgi:hypothetical protein
LENQVDFFYLDLRPGDVLFVNSQVRVLFYGKTSLLQWAVIPESLAGNTCEKYFTCSEGHTFNFPLVAVDYLNRFVGRIDDQAFESLKKIISVSIDDECWNGCYSLENKDFRFCQICKNALFWRYVVCSSCSQDPKALCLKCREKHSCLDIKFVEKFSPVELDTFLSRVENNKKSEIQKNLVKSQAFEWENQKISVVFDPDERKNVENSFIFRKIESSSPEALSQSDDSYKRKGRKKLKISENSQNGSCFVEEKSEEFFEDDFETSKRQRKSNNFNKSKKKEMGNGKAY